MGDIDWEKLAESIPQTEVDSYGVFLKQYNKLDKNHPDNEKLLEIWAYLSAYEDGEKDMLLMALKLSCELKESPIPQGVAQRVRENLIKWSELEVKTLDKAFEVEKKKNFRLDAERKKHSVALKIYSRIVKLSKKERRPIDDNLFDEVGNDFGIGKTLAKDYYYEQKNRIDALLERIGSFRK
jgi:hypothetical protein